MPSEAETSSKIAAFVACYNQLTASNLSSISAIYHPDVEFIDPVHKVQGIIKLTEYLSGAYAKVKSCQFSVVQQIEQHNLGFVSWQMAMVHPAINKGREVQLAGCTELRWQNSLIVYQRDYYDLDAMVFHHLPLLGWITGKIKQKMAASAAEK